MKMHENLVLLAAGGTGGHLFPAEALAHALARLDIEVALATDERAANYASGFPARSIHALPSATPSGGGILKKLGAAASIAQGTFHARQLIKKLKPSLVVGFGGYPTVPPILAAGLCKVPSLIHEQNAVLGRANKFLAKRVTAIATGFAEVKGLDGALAQKAVHIGNPLRPAVQAASVIPYEIGAPEGVFRLVITGGSQGARVMSDVVPAALAKLTPVERSRLQVTQQARAEDLARVRMTYTDLGISADVQSFFTDLPQKMANAHFVIARAGASTVSELAALGRPSILVPLPGSLDQDQAGNARVLASAGAAVLRMQADFTPDWLAAILNGALLNPEPLGKAAEAARSLAILDASARLAHLVAHILHGGTATNFQGL